MITSILFQRNLHRLVACYLTIPVHIYTAIIITRRPVRTSLPSGSAAMAQVSSNISIFSHLICLILVDITCQIFEIFKLSLKAKHFSVILKDAQICPFHLIRLDLITSEGSNFEYWNCMPEFSDLLAFCTYLAGEKRR